MPKSAVLIGIDYEGTPNQLRGCSQDVANIREALKSYRFDTRLLCDDRRIPGSVAMPVKENIMKELKTLTSKTGTLFVHYSGHGAYQRDLQGDELDSQDEYLYVLKGIILDDELSSEFFKNIRPRTKALVLMDCCHSGTICDLRFRDTATGNILENTNDPTKADVITISGCLDTQTSADAYIDGKYQGAMTAAFLYALRSTKGNVTVEAFVDVMRNFLANGRYPQIPQLTYTRVGAPQKMMSYYLA